MSSRARRRTTITIVKNADILCIRPGHASPTCRLFSQIRMFHRNWKTSFSFRSTQLVKFCVVGIDCAITTDANIDTTILSNAIIMSSSSSTSSTCNKEEPISVTTGPPSDNVPPSSEPPSGFILKLFQMVNGAPDEVISVRTLPHYFVGHLLYGTKLDLSVCLRMPIQLCDWKTKVNDLGAKFDVYSRWFVVRICSVNRSTC